MPEETLYIPINFSLIIFLNYVGVFYYNGIQIILFSIELVNLSLIPIPEDRKVATSFDCRADGSEFETRMSTGVDSAITQLQW